MACSGHEKVIGGQLRLGEEGYKQGSLLAGLGVFDCAAAWTWHHSPVGGGWLRDALGPCVVNLWQGVGGRVRVGRRDRSARGQRGQGRLANPFPSALMTIATSDWPGQNSHVRASGHLQEGEQLLGARENIGPQLPLGPDQRECGSVRELREGGTRMLACSQY